MGRRPHSIENIGQPKITRQGSPLTAIEWLQRCNEAVDPLPTHSKSELQSRRCAFRLLRATSAAGRRARSPQQNPREKPYVATEESQERCPKKPVVKHHGQTTSGIVFRRGRFATKTAETFLVTAGQVFVSPRLTSGAARCQCGGAADPLT
jgi:hypothetical protein